MFLMRINESLKYVNKPQSLEMCWMVTGQRDIKCKHQNLLRSSEE